MRIRLIRHATLVVEFGGQSFLVDPMLDEVGARDPIVNSPNPRKNPLVALPETAAEVVARASAILVTHTHSDHWDTTAERMLPRELPLFCQPEDRRKFADAKFTDVRSVEGVTNWKGIEISRTGGQHGTGEIAKMLAPVSGFVMQSQNEAALYVAGDTIWCDEMKSALDQFRPSVIVVNAGGARFLEGDAITMTPEDVMAVCRYAPQAQIVAVHMEAINHCLVTRADLAFQLEAARVIGQVAIPGDGDFVHLALAG
jgi:L-ascorbate metabolism protein UlaG (beta-lactamase superfamily)